MESRSEGKKVLKERRKTWTEDLAVWEKRVCLWGMTFLVGIATAEIVNMSSSVKIWKAEMIVSKEALVKHELRLDKLDEDVIQLRLKSNDQRNEISNLRMRYPKRRIEKPLMEDDR